MQAVVTRSELSGSEVTVVATFDDHINVDIKQYGQDATLLSVPNTAIQNRFGQVPILTGDWRSSSKVQVLSAEATRRIDETFPDYSQRNAIAELEGYMLSSGVDPSKWTAVQRGRKAEIDRCWNYVNAVRAANTKMMSAALPSDPTADSNWPTRISPYQP